MKVRLQISITTFVVLAGFFTIFLSALEASAKSTNPYLCRCTCFGTNTTVVPLFSPIDPQNPCTTCTRQFCLNQSLEACRGARIERPDADTGTGWEGEVWAKCLRPDSERDKTIISLYILVIFALLAFAALRDRYPTWMEDPRLQGPQSVYRAVINSPWLQSIGGDRSGGTTTGSQRRRR